jgi:hypothetical protein
MHPLLNGGYGELQVFALGLLRVSKMRMICLPERRLREANDGNKSAKVRNADESK